MIIYHCVKIKIYNTCARTRAGCFLLNSYPNIGNTTVLHSSNLPTRGTLYINHHQRRLSDRREVERQTSVTRVRLTFSHSILHNKSTTALSTRNIKMLYKTCRCIKFLDFQQPKLFLYNVVYIIRTLDSVYL